MPDESRARDDKLVRACRLGDESAWEALILRYRRLIYSVPVTYKIAAPDADEIFQRVAVKLFENLAKLRDAGALPAWLVVTTRRECQAFLRKGRNWDSIEDETGPELSEDAPEIVESIHRVECEHTLALAFARLDEVCARLLHALYREEPTPPYQEISQRLDRPIGSLGPTRSRCLRKLNRLYLGLGGAEP